MDDSTRFLGNRRLYPLDTHSLVQTKIVSMHSWNIISFLITYFYYHRRNWNRKHTKVVTQRDEPSIRSKYIRQSQGAEWKVRWNELTIRLSNQYDSKYLLLNIALRNRKISFEYVFEVSDFSQLAEGRLPHGEKRERGVVRWGSGNAQELPGIGASGDDTHPGVFGKDPRADNEYLLKRCEQWPGLGRGPRARDRWPVATRALSRGRPTSLVARRWYTARSAISGRRLSSLSLSPTPTQRSRIPSHPPLHSYSPRDPDSCPLPRIPTRRSRFLRGWRTSTTCDLRPKS